MHGVLDDLDEARKRNFKRNGGELGGVILGRGVRRRDGGAGNADAHPFAEAGVVAQLGGIRTARALDVREPVARFRVDMDFVKRMAFDLVRVDAEDEVAVGGLGIELVLLLAGEVPMRVEPVRVARGEEKFFGAVGFRQLDRKSVV